MKKEAKIKYELQEIWYALLNAKTAFYYAEYLFNPPTSKEKDYMRHYGVELQFFRNVLWRNSIIEISKLFKKTEKRSIEKFLNKVSGGGSLNKVIPKDLIENWRLKLGSSNEIIDKVLKLRDKVFAHTEMDYKDTRQYEVFEKDVEKLIILAKDFITEMFDVFDAGVVHSENLLRDDFKVLEILADYETERENKIMERFKKFSENNI